MGLKQWLKERQIKNLQRKIIIWTARQKLITRMLKQDKKMLKYLMGEQAETIINEHLQPNVEIELCDCCKQIKEANKKCTSCKK